MVSFGLSQSANNGNGASIENSFYNNLLSYHEIDL